VTTILAAVDNSAACAPVLAMASALAPVLGASVRAVEVADEPGRTVEACTCRQGIPLTVVPGDPLERIVELAADDDVVAVVVGTRGRPVGRHPVGHTALALADRLDKPVVMVPPDAVVPDHLGRVLIAMGGSQAKARGLRRAVRIAAGAGVELVVVHVDDEDSIPSFSDQVQHETAAYAHEFIARYCGGAADVRLESRVGDPAREILAAAEDVHPELLALGWPPADEPHRGDVVREVLERSPVPVLLVAVG
jgi:nucleotide-binding universal stress UspA family protein